MLASTSPYRRELLERLQLPFLVESPRVDETPLPAETPEAIARRLALAKAEAVAARHPQAIVIGSDQTATLDGIGVIGKPGNHRAAVAQLKAASGRELLFHTALAVLCPATGFRQLRMVDTRVRLRRLDAARIEAYLAREPAYDCAGSARVESLGIALIERIDGPDPTALVGLPLIELTDMLADAGLPVLG